MKREVSIALVVLLAVAGLATAQTKSSAPTRPDWQLDPSYGSLELEAGFYPDPNFTNVTAGGDVNLDSMGYFGFVAEAPDLDLYYDAGGNSLYIYVSDQDDDTVLLINDPSGNWHYNDDAIGWQPGIEFARPESGMYNIWVGTYGSGLVDAEIAISEIHWNQGVSGSSTIPDWSLESSYGSLDLSAGFAPDPQVTSVLAGGSVDLGSIGFYGYVAEAPDLDLYYDAGGFDLYIYVAEQDADTVLLVNDPNGEWHFNDDAQDLRPGIHIPNPESGMYNIWVGTFESDMVSAEVAISEMEWEFGSGGATPDMMLDPTYGSVDLNAGFKVPYEIEIIGGGSVDLSSLGYYGNVAEAPDFSVYFESAGRPLYVYVLGGSDDDTVLLINDPNGNWLYNDDADGLGFLSGITIRGAESGRYDIWVGTYSGDFIDTTLVISESRW